MEKQPVAAGSTYPKKRTEFLSMIKSACLNSSSADTGKGRSKLSSNKVTHGFHLVEGKSGHDMEDYHVAEYRPEKNHELGLFAIFDGHLGDGVPSYLRDNLFNNILKEPNFWNDPLTAIKNAYRSTDKFILENSTRLGPGGSTAVTAIVIDGKDLWVANIGDSRAVLCERGCANQLTVDHEPHSERKRIEKQGGFVTTLPGDVPRVNGQLAVARAFGDQSLKAHLSSEPDVRHVPIDPSVEFVILASDGLWKVIKNQEAVDLVKPIKDPQAAAKRLTTEALARKSKDDISSIVIRFRC
ncbi:probable protein phosphatase 2C 44 [Aristolochia californica]|uniref:probable protein phosphatase 2C 44 n=1 Tax=Aristolochia californica TaxID=171875 RepID=UPI0035DF3048